MVFDDRADAGRLLASTLDPFRDESPVVLGLPRGGVVVAFEIARALSAPLDIWAVREVGAPGQEELGLGAVAEGGETYINEELAAPLGLTLDDIDELVDIKSAEVEDRARRFRRGRPPPDLRSRT